MKSVKILLRTAAALMVVHLIGHTIGHAGWKKPADPAQLAVVKQMNGPKFPFMGVNRSMGEYFDGYGIGCSIAMLIFILVLWSISSELSTSPRLAKKAMVSISLCLLAWGIDELIFFFPFAASLTLIAFVCTLAAYFLYKPDFGDTQQPSVIL
jgi:hypothetical protein